MTNDHNAIVFSGKGEPLKEENYEMPNSINDDEAIVEISMSTVCGSDVHTWLGHRPFPTPSILGHEMVGKITKLGNNITHDFLGNPISLGDLNGNRFIITVRDITKKPFEKSEFINYFGEQRFGKHNVEIGIAILKKDFKKASSLIDYFFVQEHLKQKPNDYVGAIQKVPFKILKILGFLYK